MKSDPVAPVRRRRTAKGRRPFFFEDPNTDKLLSMVAALAGEVAVLRQRLDTHERIAELRQLFTIEDIETFSPDQPTSDARARRSERPAPRSPRRPSACRPGCRACRPSRRG